MIDVPHIIKKYRCPCCGGVFKGYCEENEFYPLAQPKRAGARGVTHYTPEEISGRYHVKVGSNNAGQFAQGVRLLEAETNNEVRDRVRCQRRKTRGR